MKLKEIVEFLENKAPLVLQEEYDNSGLIVGNPQALIAGAIICLDSTEDVIDEAIACGYNLIIAHHPIVFSGLKKITGRNYVERILIKAIKNDIAIYAIHTNLDNIQNGVNQKMSDLIGLVNQRILEPKINTLYKLVTYVPTNQAEKVRSAMFAAGAGRIGNYDNCSFNVEGNGTFRGNAQTKPFVGTPLLDHSENEVRIEMIVQSWQKQQVISAMKQTHPYEEVAFDLYKLDNLNQDNGSGMIGDLKNPMDSKEFLNMLKRVFYVSVVRHTRLCNERIQKVALCGGSGSFLLAKAIAEGADIFVTSDFKYHQFFDAENRIIIADIGHFETEQFTPEILRDWLGQYFPTFATRLTTVVTNPVNYF